MERGLLLGDIGDRTLGIDQFEGAIIIDYIKHDGLPTVKVYRCLDRVVVYKLPRQRIGVSGEKEPTTPFLLKET